MKGILYAPNGKRIVGTCDTMLVTSRISAVERAEDGSLELDFNGYDDHGNSIRQETNAAGRLLYATRDGEEWPENQLIFIPEGGPLPEFDKNASASTAEDSTFADGFGI